MITLEEQLSSKRAEIGVIGENIESMSQRKRLMKDRLAWLTAQAGGLRYAAATGDQTAQAELTKNQAEAGNIGEELQSINDQLAAIDSRQRETQAEIARLALDIRLREFHQLRLQALEAYLNYYNTVLSMGNLLKRAVELKDQVQTLFQGFYSERISGCDPVNIPPMADTSKPAFIEGEIAKERAALASLTK